MNDYKVGDEVICINDGTIFTIHYITEDFMAQCLWAKHKNWYVYSTEVRLVTKLDRALA